MKPEYGVRKWLWRVGLVPRGDFEAEVELRKRAQEKSYRYFYESVRLKDRLEAIGDENSN